MECPEIILCVAERPYEPADRPSEDIKHWTTMELDARDVIANTRLRALEERIDRINSDNGAAHSKTRIALVVTVVTTVCSVATTLATYFTSRTSTGSN